MILLDTCTLLWLVAGDAALSKRASDQISKYKNSLYISSISSLEIALKHKRKKILLPLPAKNWFAEALDFHGINEITIDQEICVTSTELPDIHNDPFDRIIIATALVNGMQIITPDRDIALYKSVSCVW